jgi:hypothetical protein
VSAPAKAQAATGSKLRTGGVLLLGAATTLAYGHFGAGLGPGAPLVLLALGGLVLGFSALALFRVIDPLIHGERVRAEVNKESVRLRELERDKQLVLRAIREVEHDYQMRKVSEAHYQEMIQRYRARAMRLIREIDAGDDFRTLIEQELKARLAALDAAAEGPGAPAGRACPACAAGNDPDAVYCKKCGKALAAAPAKATT